MLVKNALIVGKMSVLSAKKRRVVFVCATDTLTTLVLPCKILIILNDLIAFYNGKYTK